MEAQNVQWRYLTNKKILFGHQSVGENLLEGVAAHAESDNIKFPVYKLGTKNLEAGIAHVRIGTNGDPFSKLRAFKDAVDQAAPSGLDIAVMKFCYVDFGSGVDPDEVARAYVVLLRDMSARYPNIKFIAVTAPLTVIQSGPKSWIKRLLGRAPAQLQENAARDEFNARVRKEFSGAGQLFDLARIESAGARPVDYVGRMIPSLNPAWTDDGGHLNPAGQLSVSAEFLNSLAETVAASGPGRGAAG